MHMALNYLCAYICTYCTYKYKYKKEIDTGFDTCKSCSVDMDMMDIDVVDMVDMVMVQSSESYIFTV